LTAHQVRVAALFSLLSPDSHLRNTTLPCASIVSCATSFKKLETVEPFH